LINDREKEKNYRREKEKLVW